MTTKSAFICENQRSFFIEEQLYYTKPETAWRMIAVKKRAVSILKPLYTVLQTCYTPTYNIMLRQHNWVVTIQV